MSLRFKLIYLFLVWCQVALLGIDIVSAFVDRMTDRFRGYIGTGKTYPRGLKAQQNETEYCTSLHISSTKMTYHDIIHRLGLCLSDVCAPPTPVARETRCYDRNRSHLAHTIHISFISEYIR